MRVLLVSLSFAAALLVGACKPEKPPSFRVEQRHEAPIPGLSGVVVKVSDIETAKVQTLSVNDARGEEIATGGPFLKGDTLLFAHAGTRYQLVVDKIDYHFTGRDYVFLYVEPAK